MRIQEAINSGKPFRRSGVATRYSPGKAPQEIPQWKWIIVNREQLGLQFRWQLGEDNLDELSQVALNADDILADDWEIKP